MRERSPQLLLMALRRLLFRSRHAALRSLVEEAVNAAWDENYHFSDFLKVLSEFVTEDNVFGSNGSEQTRTTVAALLEAAATEAETTGRELP